MIVIVFWYQFFTEPKLIEYPSNPIIYFTNPLWEVLKFYAGNTIKGLTLITPLFLSSVISIIEIPYRIKIEMGKKKASR
jgi:hypothetical protein